ncbi:hypothetical protein JXQ70_14195 [bacterium]|nr:hypothetical protein [bacterium]
MQIPEHLRLCIGDRGRERDLPAYLDSPTWIVDSAWDQFAKVAKTALAAYMNYCKTNNLPHSYLLGLDILVMGSIDPNNPRHIIDIRPTMVEGPCCNSYPACPNLWASRLYGQLKLKGFNPDLVEYPTHPEMILDKICRLFSDIWEVKGDSSRKPVCAVFTRPYDLSEEETAHVTTLNALKAFGYEAYRITPEEKPEVKEGKIWVHGKPIDMVWRRIERIHLPGQANPPGRDDEKWVEFYGEEFAKKVVNETPKTIWINPWKIDDLRSKTIEEKAFRLYEETNPGKTISRPITLLGDQVNAKAVSKLADLGGWVMKRWNSTGGKGVFMHVNLEKSKTLCDHLYNRYDGRHMLLMDTNMKNEELAKLDAFNEDSAVQLMRFPDARDLGGGKKLVYDTRINVLYNPKTDEWEFLSGMSRSVPCGEGVDNGNSLLTNVSMGAEISPLIMGHVKKGADRSQIKYGPILTALMNGKTETTF